MLPTVSGVNKRQISSGPSKQAKANGNAEQTSLFVAGRNNTAAAKGLFIVAASSLIGVCTASSSSPTLASSSAAPTHSPTPLWMSGDAIKLAGFYVPVIVGGILLCGVAVCYKAVQKCFKKPEREDRIERMSLPDAEDGLDVSLMRSSTMSVASMDPSDRKGSLNDGLVSSSATMGSFLN